MVDELLNVLRHQPDRPADARVHAGVGAERDATHAVAQVGLDQGAGLASGRPGAPYIADEQ
ncbi:MAG: hypothetical protein V4750_10930, partial [Pseudomonadota bacterium]